MGYTKSGHFCSILCTITTTLLVLHCEARSQHGHHHHRDRFVRARGTEFVLHGKPFLFNGFNSYWMMSVAAEPAERGKVSEVFREAAANGLSVCRTWAFSDGGGDRALQASPGVYNERVFQGLDFVISEARRYGVRLILSLVNSFKDFGGKAQYVEWAKNAGVGVNSEDDFYTNPVVKGYYKNHIKGWAQEMASYTKSLDRKHMLEVGMEGFYGESMPEKKQYNPGFQVGTDYITSNLVREIDFATIHAYPDIWLSGQNDAAQTAFVQRWMWSHWNDARRILRKPLVFAEFGKSKRDAGAGRRGSMAGGLVWQAMAEGMESYYDGYEIVLSQEPSTTGVVARQSRAMAALSGVLSSRAAEAATAYAAGGRQRVGMRRHPHRRHRRNHL
uniref:mannan endo-1,4-beta-mannosidase n=1 Tax=Ananas comosus var. bracteatus TaxID=296719 RepID=A0A6V7Q1Y7_ANACO|nr:unnamed protein product [Ananas comosus var. bracteatus]